MLFPHLKTLIESIQVNLPAKASVNSADEDGTGINLASVDQYHSGLVLCAIGAATGTPSAVSVAFTLEHSDDDSTYTTATDVNGDNAVLTLTGTSATSGTIDIFPNQLKQYVRLNRTVALTGGTSPTVPTVGMILLGAGRTV